MQRTANVSRLLSRSLSPNGTTAGVHYGATGSDIEGLFHEHVAKNTAKRKDQPDNHLLTAHREAIDLYRDIWRYSRLFIWTNETGRVWRDVIRESARKEFEQARHETDPEMIARMLLVGRDAVMQAKDKFMEQRQKIEDQESARVFGAGQPSA